MAPALEASVKGGFPNLLPSLVRAIITAHQKRKAVVQGTAVPALEVVAELDEISDETVESGGDGSPIAPIGSPRAQDEGGASGVVADSGGSFLSDNDADVGTDLSGALGTTSARFLISDSPLKSTSKLAAPIIQSVPVDLRPDYSVLRTGPKDLDLAVTTALAAEVHRLRGELRKAQQVSTIEKSINEAANAQLVLRDLHLGELMEQLHTKEEAKGNQKRRKMASKNARWLTGVPFMNELRGIAEEEEGQPVMVAGDGDAEAVEAEEVVVVAVVAVDPLPGETKTKWRERERADRAAKQNAALEKWEKEAVECESRGLPVPAKPKVRKFFPAPATPPSLKTTRSSRGKKKVSDNAETINIDVGVDGGGEIGDDFEDN